MRFYLGSALALLLLYLLTLPMEPSQAVTGVRAGIGFGLALAGVKIVLRHYNIGRPPRR
jgi:hypothetical protein